jgi:hypothetical protein
MTESLPSCHCYVLIAPSFTCSCLVRIATIPAGNIKANGIIPHPFVEAIAITPIIINTIQTALVFRIIKVIGIAAIYKSSENATPPINGFQDASVASCLCCCSAN